MEPGAGELDAVYRRNGPGIYRLALAITADPQAAEDVVQEAFCRVLGRESGEDVRRIDAYLYRTARHLAIDHIRRRQADRSARAEVEAAAAAARIDATTPGVDAEAVWAALLRLPVEQREVVVLRVWEELAFADIAERLETPLGTVHSRYRYALQRLRPLLAAVSRES